MKKIVYILCIVLIILFIVTTYMLWPIKFSVDIKETIINKEYIIVESQSTTSANWKAIGDENGMYDIPLDVKLNGNYPKVTYDILTGDNMYICYAKFVDTITTEAGYQNVIYDVKDWDIVYPIDRGKALSLLPKKWLCHFDIRGRT